MKDQGVRSCLAEESGSCRRFGRTSGRSVGSATVTRRRSVKESTVEDLARLLIIAGGMLVLAGAALLLLGKLGFGRLPGDIVLQWGGVRIFIPIATSILLSFLLTVILRILRK
jgi:hypothetical protein